MRNMFTVFSYVRTINHLCSVCLHLGWNRCAQALYEEHWLKSLNAKVVLDYNGTIFGPTMAPTDKEAIEDFNCNIEARTADLHNGYSKFELCHTVLKECPVFLRSITPYAWRHITSKEYQSTTYTDNQICARRLYAQWQEGSACGQSRAQTVGEVFRQNTPPPLPPPPVLSSTSLKPPLQSPKTPHGRRSKQPSRTKRRSRELHAKTWQKSSRRL